MFMFSAQTNMLKYNGEIVQMFIYFSPNMHKAHFYFLTLYGHWLESKLLLEAFHLFSKTSNSCKIAIGHCCNFANHMHYYMQQHSLLLCQVQHKRYMLRCVRIKRLHFIFNWFFQVLTRNFTIAIWTKFQWKLWYN